MASNANGGIAALLADVHWTVVATVRPHGYGLGWHVNGEVLTVTKRPRQPVYGLAGAIREVCRQWNTASRCQRKGDADGATCAAYRLGVATATLAERAKRHAGGRTSSTVRSEWKRNLRAEADTLAAQLALPLDKVFYQLAAKHGKSQSTIRNSYYSARP